jgi:hypothetical protein
MGLVVNTTAIYSLFTAYRPRAQPQAYTNSAAAARGATVTAAFS